MTEYTWFAPCPRGLEAPLAQELVACGGKNLDRVPGGVGFRGELSCGYRANLNSALATRILRRVGFGRYAVDEDIYRLTRALDWPQQFDLKRNFRVYVTARKTNLRSTEFITLRIKDAVCDRFRDQCGQRPNVDTQQPDVRIHAFFDAQTVTLYVDTSGEPLWLRGQKVAKVVAPLKENLAAGILRLSGWQPRQPLLDPMCGSGTFLLEAARISLEEAPGLARAADQFGLSRLADFDASLWRQIRTEAQKRRQPVDTLPIFGSDVSADAIERSRQNLAHARLEKAVTLTCQDFLHTRPPSPSGVLIANPPYGARIGEDAALAAFYPLLGDHLKRHFAGWRVYLLSADSRLPKLIGLKPSRKTPLFNGALECRLYEFVMVAGGNRGRRVE